jgi:hypothetical protein
MKIIGLTISVLLTGCATQPEKIDATPKNPTVVLKASGVISGAILPDSTFQQLAYTRNDKRSISDKYKYDSWIANKFLSSDNTIIFRMDKNLRWLLSDKTYFECPLSGCSANLLAQFKMNQNNAEEKEEQFQYDPAEDTGCQLSPGENKFTVTETGQTRVISGYETKEYRATWLIEYKDENGGTDKNTLNIVFWNTAPTAAIDEVWKINEEATRAYRAGVKKDANPLSLLLPDDLFDALSAFSGDTSKQNKQWNNSVSQKLATAKGYPISIKIDWYLDRNACPETQAKAEKKGFDWSNPLGAAKKFAGKKVQGMFAPNPNEPIFHYVYEINSVAIEPVHDSVFEIPGDYKLVTRE